ncbi:GNAT family N-acetyltransferase [Clostridium botulinum]|uniref:N-acetyltransferase domain-containing protein n=1 Tax=Clostridium botulinum C/D str. DC5 TaxID=1443128 RepID=A0A0A0I8L7_CLOBO|nr:GNAT family N-acetyltransferase [Clostridium botulinum]KGM97197.1 hypothetical protein Z955_12445 [Clostridium botulinum C/D str. DC5]KOC55345.1 hypothetical protein ADU89_05685 [Clostridium botulinum]KOC56784.1 hypothetical protein ADU90_07235 [Clostridium botulinum]MCD3235148.1 GNAT family N-acetyltransferase [Clostridium botulinum D/C]MCD3241072.1 GNAT family N-acetyltransferase [Clostridium botulinum D/C]
MDSYLIEKIEQNDINRIVDIYNSNKIFLYRHIGTFSISREFILGEIEKMKKIGFNSSIIKDIKGEIVGLCDFKISDEVYISLLMLDNKLRGNGLGTIIYNQLEKEFKSNNAKRIRIDVVYDYEKNSLGFWKKQGFMSGEKIKLEWNGYKSNAVKMYKAI